MLVYVTENGNVSSEVVTTWFKMLEETHFFSNQRNVRSDTSLLSDMMQTVQALAAVLSVRFASLPETELGTFASKVLETDFRNSGKGQIELLF
jgi:hypothetical protein